MGRGDLWSPGQRHILYIICNVEALPLRYSLWGVDILKRKGEFIIGLIILIGLLIVYGLIEPYWIKEKTVTINNQEIPKQFNDVKIVFMSDIHHGPFLSKKRLAKVVDRVNSLEPDIILMGGDYVQYSPKYIEPCFKELEKLKADIGVYGVLGNHDHLESQELTRQFMKEAGILSIDNKSYWIEKGEGRIKVGGVGDYYYDIQNIEHTVYDVQSEDFVILVTHNPDYLEELETDKIDLAFAGHTHGGQVTFFGLWAPLIPSRFGQKYRTGLLSNDNMKVIVSNGIGTVALPIRFFARPQIVTVSLKNNQ